jgi:hypothetical protein
MIRGGDLENRQVIGGEEFEAARQKLGGRKKSEPEAPPSFAERIAAARALRPPKPQIEHCGHCWGEGRDAALRALEG